VTRLPIRVRLTFAFAFAMAIVLVLVGVFVYLRVASDLSSTLDDGLRTRVDDIARQLQTAGPDEIGLGGAQEEGAEDILSEVIRLDGSLVASSEPVQQTSVLDAGQLAAAGRSESFFDAGSVPGIENEARLLARPVQTDEGRFIVLTGVSTGDRAETLSGLVKSFVIGGLLALLLASALGYGLATLAFRPVDEMRRRAGRITLERSGERLPLPASDDEIARLGRTLNEMLARIESSIERERSFVADAGHELRTPLAILRGELELGMRPDRNKDERQAAMRSAIDEADRLQRLADDLLALARSDASQLPLEPDSVAIPELLERTRARLAPQAAALGRTIRVEASPDISWILDPNRIEAALGNLVENALRHGAGPIDLAAAEEGDELELTVSDEGEGFSEEFAERAFDRFARAEAGRTSNGSGLGLAISRAIVEAHGGRIEINRDRERGARVVIRIPGASSN